jgi:hypothetical protein
MIRTWISGRPRRASGMGNLHTYEYNLLGRIVHDRVTTPGTGVDPTVRHISTTWNALGQRHKVTSYDHHDLLSGGSVVNEVEFLYDPFGNLKNDRQSITGPITTGTLKFAYDHADGSANTARLKKTTYPNGREVENQYVTRTPPTSSYPGLHSSRSSARRPPREEPPARHAKRNSNRHRQPHPDRGLHLRPLRQLAELPERDPGSGTSNQNRTHDEVNEWSGATWTGANASPPSPASPRPLPATPPGT